MKVFLIRHPKPNDTEGLCYGRLDVSVDPALLGMTLAKVRQRIPADVLRVAPVFTSPLSRCADFARQLAFPHTAIVADELVEIDFGTWEGQRWNDVPREELDDWVRDLWAYRPGGGENAQALAIRWQRWLHQVSLSNPDAVIAVTHAGVIRVALACAGQLTLDDMVQSTIEFSSVHCIDHAGTVHGATAEIRAEV